MVAGARAARIAGTEASLRALVMMRRRRLLNDLERHHLHAQHTHQQCGGQLLPPAKTGCAKRRVHASETV